MANILESASVLLCLVRTVKVFLINFVYRAIVICAVLAFEAEMCFSNIGTNQSVLYGAWYVVWW
jgi:hypothetical protein